MSNHDQKCEKYRICKVAATLFNLVSPLIFITDFISPLLFILSHHHHHHHLLPPSPFPHTSPILYPHVNPYPISPLIHLCLSRSCLPSLLALHLYLHLHLHPQCCLCHLALGDAVASRGKLEEFKGVDYSFPSSRECEFLEKLLTVSTQNTYSTFLLFSSPPCVVSYT